MIVKRIDIISTLSTTAPPISLFSPELLRANRTSFDSGRSQINAIGMTAIQLVSMVRFSTPE